MRTNTRICPYFKLRTNTRICPYKQANRPRSISLVALAKHEVATCQPSFFVARLYLSTKCRQRLRAARTATMVRMVVVMSSLPRTEGSGGRGATSASWTADEPPSVALRLLTMQLAESCAGATLSMVSGTSVFPEGWMVSMITFLTLRNVSGRLRGKRLG